MPRTKEAEQAWRDANRELVRARNREYRRKRMQDPVKRAKINQKNTTYRHKPETRNKVLNWRLKHDYGLSLDTYNHMLSEQGGTCFICRRPETKVLNGKITRLAVDHDHVTGHVRRLLCAACNAALGLLDENSDRALALASYIDSFNKDK